MCFLGITSTTLILQLNSQNLYTVKSTQHTLENWLFTMNIDLQTGYNTLHHIKTIVLNMTYRWPHRRSNYIVQYNHTDYKTLTKRNEVYLFGDLVEVSTF